ncbi:MAG: hypothetical protein ACLT98_06315 [Eggerthellaceae bacterium]
MLTASPADFRGGDRDFIHGAVGGGARALVLFFLSAREDLRLFAEAKRPEVVLKLFVRFVLAHAAVVYGLELMMAFLDVVQGLIGDMMDTVGFASAAPAALPGEMVEAIEDVGFLDAIPLWAVTLLGGLLVTVLSFIMILAVYGRFFKIYMYTALAPIPLSTFAGEPSQSVGKAFLKSYGAVCLEGAVILLACVIFSLFASRRRWWMPRLRGHAGVVVRGRARLQHAGAHGHGQDGRPRGARDDGALTPLPFPETTERTHCPRRARGALRARFAAQAERSKKWK